MKRRDSVQNRRRQLVQRLMSLAVVSAATLAGTTMFGGQVMACEQCEYGESCDQPGCGIAEPTCGCGSTACGGCGKFKNPVMKTLDAVAGGIEKVLGLDSCGDSHCDVACDDACDAAFANELMTPLPPQPHVHSHAPAPVPMIQASPRMPSVPPLVTPVPSGPTTTPRATTPQSVVPVDPTVPAPGTTLPPSGGNGNTDGAIETVPTPDTKKPDGSIFDNLDDPFGDDEVRARPRGRQVYPASTQQSSASPTIGSGLRRLVVPGNQRPHVLHTRRRVSSPQGNPAGVQPVSHMGALQPLTDPTPNLRPLITQQQVITQQGQNMRGQMSVAPQHAPAAEPLQAGRVLAPYRRSSR